MDRRTIAFAAVMAALMLASAIIVVSDSEESDASSYRYTDSKSFTVGTAVSGTTSDGPSNDRYTWSASPITGSVPGVSATYGTSGGHECIEFSGTPSTANTYTVVAEWTCTYTRGLLYEVGDTYKLTVTVTVTGSTPTTTYTVNFAAGTGGSVSKSSQSTTSTSGTFSCTATASSGYTFSAWRIGGQVYSTSATVTGNISQHDGQTLLATFTAITPTTHTVSFSASPSGSGSFSSNSITAPDGASYTVSGSHITFTKGSWSATVTATASSGYSFDYWSSSSGTVTGTTAITAYFTSAPTYTVTFDPIPTTAYGSVSPTFVAVASGTTYTTSGATISFSDGQSATAYPESGYSFDHWSSTSGTITSNKTITATFHETSPTVTFLIGSGGQGAVNPSSVIVPYGTTYTTSGNTITFSNGASATATAATGYVFSQWMPAHGTVNSSTSIYAQFTATSPTMTISVQPSSDRGSVSSNSVTVPYGTTFTSSGTTLTFSDGQSVTASPATGYVFNYWSPSSGTVTMNDYIHAWFVPANVTVTFIDDGHGTVSPASLSVPYGSTYTTSSNVITFSDGQSATASPNTGYVFSQWGAASGTIHGNTNIHAYFASDGTNYTVTFHHGSGGSVSPSSVTVPNGTTFSTSGNTMTFSDGQSVTATPNAQMAIDHWSTESGTVRSDMDITVYFVQVAATITMRAAPTAGGTISPSSLEVAIGTTYTTSGNTVTFSDGQSATATPNQGYVFGAWPHASGTITSSVEWPVTFIQYVTIQIGISPSLTGTVSPASVTVPSGTAFSAAGSTMTFSDGSSVTATPNQGYAFAGWSPSDGTVSPLTSITAQFVDLVTIQIGIDPTVGGSAVPSSVTVPNGTIFTATDNILTFSDGTTVTATPATNYSFHQWIPASGTVSPSTQITASFTTSVMLTVNFREYPTDVYGSFSRSSISVPYGTIYTKSSDAISFSDGQTVTAIPASNGVFAGWASSTTEGTITQDTTFAGDFSKALQDVVFNTYPQNKGTFSPAGLSNIPYGTAWTASGDTVTFSTSPVTTVVFTPENGYVLDHWAYDSGTVSGYEQAMITALVERDPSATMTVSIRAEGGGGTVSANSLTVPYDTHWYMQDNTIVFETAPTTTVTATPNTGFFFDHWSPMGSGYIRTDSTFHAYFTSNPPTDVRVTINAGSNGSVESSSPLSVMVPYGTAFSSNGNVLTVGSHTYTAVPDADYTFDGWNPASGTAVSSSVTWITASFVRTTPIPTYTLTLDVSPLDGGSLSETTLQVPEGAYFGVARDTLQIIEGDGVVGTIIDRVYAYPNTGYELGSWSNIGGTMTGPRTVTANFTTDMINVSIAAGPGGEVSQSSVRAAYGSSVLVDGNTLTFANGTVVTATPVDDFRFDSWTNAEGQITATKTITANFVGTREIVFDFGIEPEGGGRTSVLDITVLYFSTWTSEGNVLSFSSGGRTYEVTATPATGYTFHHWEPASGRATESGTIKAVFDRDFTVRVEYNQNATIYVDGNEITRTTDFIVNQDNRHTIECVPDAGYRFAYFYYADARGEEIQSDINPTQLPMADTRFAAMVVREGNVTVTFVSDGHGTVNPSTLTVPAGTRFIRDGDVLMLSTDHSIRATAEPDEGYALRGWSANVDQFIVANTRITAYFEYDMGDAVWWANNYANNRATIVLDYPQTTGNVIHYMKIPLLEYNRHAGDSQPQYFRDSGYVLSIETGYNKRIHISLAYNGIEKYAATYDPGVWQRYALILDTQNGTLSYQGISSAARNPVAEFNFMDYAPIFTNVIADWSSIEDGLAFARIYHKDVGTGTNHPNFQIGNTSTFLNTFGVVMIDPVLNIYESFPAYENLRLNLYSFALYGDTMTFNGYTFEMDGSYIVIHYEKVGNRNIISPGGTETVRIPLTNVYVTWNNIDSEIADERQCYLTFADRNQTFELGSFAAGDLTISGEGMWYFTTALWEPYDTVKKTYVMDWSSPFNLSGNGFLLIFLALLVVVLVIMNIFWQPTVLDYAVVFGAGLISLLVLGSF